jgi:hypothetical protein
MQSFIRGFSKIGFVIVVLFFCYLASAFADNISIDKELTVIRGDYKEVHVLIPPKTEDSYLEGSFSCKGGFYDDIVFLILTKDQYVRWYSSYPYKALAKFDKKTEGKFRVPVQAEVTYYFVFDNFFSTVSNKDVKLHVKLVPGEKE